VRIETIGNATLYLGDCMEIITGLAADSVVTDPPWNMGSFTDDKKAWPEYRLWLETIKRKCEEAAEGQVWFLSTKSIPYVSDCFQGYAAFASVKNFSQMTPKSLPNCWDIAFLKSTKYKGNGRNWFMCNTAGMLSDRTGHPTPRTVDVMEYMISMHDWTSVIDPFMGSGTTGVACVNLGRKFVGIEIEPKYFDIACERIAAAQSQGRLFA
jgi:site-specific DNA-methyltransferase (adenine-specific)